MTIKARLKRLARLVPRHDDRVSMMDLIAIAHRCHAEGRELTPAEVALQEEWLLENGIEESIEQIKAAALKSRTHYEDLLQERIAALKPRLPNGLKVLPDE
jgi:hypothetical protein